MFISSDGFRKRYGEAYVFPKRINQDIVESFFSFQCQLCGGNNNMTAYSYAYNINSILSYQSANLVKHSAYNVDAIQDLVTTEHCPKRQKPVECRSLEWAVDL